MLAQDLAGLSPHAVEQAFYAAISRADLDALMNLWAKRDDIVCIHPGAPRLVGAHEIRASFAAIFERGDLQVQARQMHTIEFSDYAIHNLVEEVQGENEEAHEVYLLATNIYVRTEQGWRILLHHVSITPGFANGTNGHSGLLH